MPRRMLAAVAGLVLLGGAAPALVGSAALAEGPTLDVRIDQYRAPDGARYYALQMRANDAAPAVAHDHLVVLDTSASQIGEHRRQALDVIDAYLAALPGRDRARLFAADVTVKEMTRGFATGEGLVAARAALAKRTPLGATNLKLVLETVAKSADAERPASILYVGDGMSTVDLLAADELRSLVEGLRERHVAVHSYAVGPQTDLQLLGTIAQHTGGVLLFDRGNDTSTRRPRDQDATALGRRLAKSAQQPVVYLDEFAVAGEIEMSPAVALPLRSDRTTVILAKGDLARQVDVSVRTESGEELTAETTVDAAESTNAYLAALWRTARQTDGLTVATAGDELLGFARDSFNGRVDGLLAAGDRALALGEFVQAEQVANAIRAIDPANVQGGMLLKAARTKQHGRVAIAAQDDTQPAPADPPRPNLLDDPAVLDEAVKPLADEVKPGDDSPIDVLQRRRQIATQQMLVEVEAYTRQAREAISGNDPEEAINLAKRALNAVASATDLIPEAREEMIRKLQRNQRAYENQREVLEQREIQRTERIATLEAEARLVEAMQLEEENLTQLIDQVRALLNEGAHGDDAAFEDAEAVAEEAVDLRPGNGPAEAARFTAEAAGQVNKVFRLRKLREDRWLEALYQVELSDVPFPDEPPVRWPPAPVWKALTERRRKWAAVDLKENSPNEERIRRALAEQTEMTFVDIPFSEAIEYLADLHDIPIIIDEIALDEEGIPLDEPINRVISGIQLRSGLKIILEPLGLTYIIKDEVMKITSVVVAEELGNLQIRVYPVGDLVIPVVTPAAGGIGQGFGGVGGLGGSQGGFNNAGGGLGGVGGQGGNNIGGGLGQFSVPALNRPQRRRPERNVAPVARPVEDPEMQGILGNILGDETSAVDTFTGQSLAQVLDDAAIRNLQKKTGVN